MKYTLTNQPQQISETKGEIENFSSYTIVLAAGTTPPTESTARITVSPWKSYPFKTSQGESLYAWIPNIAEGNSIEVSVVNFPLGEEGGDEVAKLSEQIQNLSGYVNVLAVEDMYAIDILNASNKNIEIETRCNLYIELTYTYESAITWFNGINWLSGFAPTLYQGKTYGINFSTKDGGASWNGMLIGGW